MLLYSSYFVATCKHKRFQHIWHKLKSSAKCFCHKWFPLNIYDLHGIEKPHFACKCIRPISYNVPSRVINTYTINNRIPQNKVSRRFCVFSVLGIPSTIHFQQPFFFLFQLCFTSTGCLEGVGMRSKVEVTETDIKVLLQLWSDTISKEIITLINGESEQN